jgi:predicted amidohydrolase
MTTLQIALLQLLPPANLSDALQKGQAFCRQAAAQGADLALFPEMWTTGYSSFDPDLAMDEGDPFVASFQSLASQLKIAVAITYLQRGPGPLARNVVSLIDRHGSLAFTYAKVHTCDFDAESRLAPGLDFYTCSLDTAAGLVKVGAMICFDREFPESARILMLQGAEIILVPNACEMEENRSGQLRARAYENMVGLALANYAGREHKGHSQAYDGIAFTNRGASRSTKLVEAGEDEGIYMASFDLDRLRSWRKREVWGNAFRKPVSYARLVSPEVAPPFKRRRRRRS